MTIALKYLLFITLIILFSCTSKVAKIELRKNVHFPQQISQENMNLDFLEESKNSKKAYLVNTSLNNTYEFTIREISTIDDTLVEYQTNKLTLSPGDEELIGGTKYLLGSKYAMSIVPDTIFTDTNLKEENVYEYKKSKFTEKQVATAADKKNLSFSEYIIKYNIRNISLNEKLIKKIIKKEILDIKTKILIDSSKELRRKTVEKKYECTGEILIKNLTK